jgi:8-oxo-dGTP pyrophosphatase MutT (NUDIX family)
LAILGRKNNVDNLISKVLHICFLVTRPLTLGARALIYDKSSNAIYLIKHTYQKGWSLPGGGVEVGESGLMALHRELEEEAGIIPVDPILKSLYYNSSVSKRDHVLVFLVDNWTLKANFTANTKEISDGKWFDLDKLPKDITKDTLFQIKEFL